MGREKGDPNAQRDFWLKVLPLVGAVVAFAWGAYQYFQNESRQSAYRRIEAAKPYLERQLKLCTEALQLTSTIATTSDDAERELAKKGFWKLYWEEMALVEDAFVEREMVTFGRRLELDKGDERVKTASLDLAHACRGSLARSWGVREWESPHWWSASGGPTTQSTK